MRVFPETVVPSILYRPLATTNLEFQGQNTFPEGIPVGVINDFNIKESDPYYNIQVKLAVNFRTLSHVKVINYLNYNEQRNIEKAAEK